MKSRNYNILPNRNRRISYIQYKEAKRLPVFKMNKYRGGFHEQIYNQRKKPFGSLAAQTLGRLYADTAMGARNGIELAFDTLLKGRNGITHRQKVMNKYLNIVDLPPVDGCDIISTLDVGMQDICEKPGGQVEGNQCQCRGSRTDGSGYRRSEGHCQHDESWRRQLLRNEQ